MRKDFVATGFIVSFGRVLLVRHRKLGLWLPVGGHIEAHETPEEALRREIMEEVGLEVEVLSRPAFECSDTNVEMLLMPNHMQLELIKHDKEPVHQHVDLVFFCRACRGMAKLNKAEHDDLKWFSAEELDSPEITENVRILGKGAIGIAGKK